MFTGLYTAASGILTHQREIDTIGNNLVNADTPGYRTDSVVISDFEKQLMTRMDGSDTQTLGTGTGSLSAVVDRVVSSGISGTLDQTGRALDFAIGGEGYFTVLGDDGNTYYTRNGNFELDDEGCLSISGLGQVMGEGGAIHLDSPNVTVNGSGQIFNAAGQAVGTLRVSAVPEGTEVEKLNNGAFRAAGNADMGAAADYQIYQNTLELSNVDMNQEMSELIRAQRAYQSCSSALQIADEMDQKASTQVASV